MRTAAFVLVVGLCLSACSLGTAASPSPSPVPSPQPTVAPTSTPGQTPAPDSDFYLRAWFSQSLPPRETFSWLPMLTIADGAVIDGNVAVPAIYPGPLMIVPFNSEVSEAGIEAVIEEARRLGLLSGESDFTGGAVMPGSRTGQIEIVVEGTTYSFTGLPETLVQCDETGMCDAEPGTPEAFSAFWHELEAYHTWLQPELGASEQYLPERVAMLLTAPPPNEPGLSPAPVAWPFETPIAEAGADFPGGGERCVTLSGEALEEMLPILEAGTQLTVFVDDEDTQAGAVVRVLVPDEPSPCPDEAAADY